MADFSVQLDTSEVDEFNRAMPREIFNATRSAIRTTTTWAEKELEKQAAAQSEIPIKAFKVWRVRSKANNELGKVWFGLDPVRARFAGKIEERSDGALAGSYFFRGKGDHYFAATLGDRNNRPGSGNTGVKSIWKRVEDTRFPVTEAKIKIEKLSELAAEIAIYSTEELLTRFSKKLNAYIEKRGSAA